MRKQICLLLLLAAALGVNAQEMHFIPKAGVNITTTTNSGASMMPGLNVGMGFEFLLAPKFALEPGLFFSMQGADYVDVNLKHDYLNIPILAKVYVYKGLHLFAGPQLGIKVSANKIAYGPDKYPGDHTTGDYRGQPINKDITNAFDVAAVIGAGYNFLYGFTLSANANIGLLNKLKSDTSFSIDDSSNETFNTADGSSKNLVFQINFGYRF